MYIRQNRASVLIMVLWLIATLSMFGIGLARITRSGYFFIKWQENRLSALPAVNAVVQICKAIRIQDKTPGYDVLYELPYESEYAYGKVKVVYSLIDEEGKININKVSSLILKNFPSMDEDKASDIVNSEFKPFYPKEKLLLVDEIDREDYDEIASLVTVYGDGRVNINTCSEETMKYLGMGSSLIERILEFRKGDDGELYTSDDGKIDSTSSMVDILKESVSLSLHEEQVLILLIGKNLLGVKSNHYRLEAKVYVNDKLIAKYSIVIGTKTGSKEYSIKEWKE